MRNRTRNRTAVLERSLWTGVASLVFLAATTGVASASTRAVETVTTDSSFGLLGPVGLAAIVLGVVGMTLGVLRQRRKAQAEEAVATEPAPASDETTRPTLTPYRRPPL